MADLAVCEEASVWDAFVSRASDSSLLQSWAWGSLRARYGWGVTRYLWLDRGRPLGAIAVLRRPLAGGFALHYAPRGPILDGHLEEWPALWQTLRTELRRAGGTILKIDPEWTSPEQRAALEAVGGRMSRHPIQHQATLLVDISGGDAALMRFKASTRRNIRAGERQGVVVEASDAPAAVDAFYMLLRESAARRRFVIRPRAYYQDVVAAFRERGQVAIYLARYRGRLCAGAVMMFFGGRLIYLVGGTSLETKGLKPGYLVHWRAIEDAQKRGCSRYDMWGVPLEPTPDHPGYGYYVFKSRFNGELVRYIGLYDLPVRELMARGIRLVERVARTGQPEFV